MDHLKRGRAPKRTKTNKAWEDLREDQLSRSLTISGTLVDDLIANGNIHDHLLRVSNI